MNKKAFILVTGDYEVGDRISFGDEMIEPTRRILQLCEQVGVRYTIFFDVCEWFSIRTEAETNEEARDAIGRQLQSALHSGHDVQLHLHPHWYPGLGNKWTGNGWQIDRTHIRLHSLPYGSPDDPASIRGLFHLGVQTLREILRPVKPDYVPSAFRAGGYAITPSERIVTIMQEVGLLADSSVWLGGYRRNHLYDFDFRRAASRFDPYPIAGDVTKRCPESSARLIEFPIASIIERRWFGLKSDRVFPLDLFAVSEELIRRSVREFAEHVRSTDRTQFCLTVTSHPKAFHKESALVMLFETVDRLLSGVASWEFATVEQAVHMICGEMEMGGLSAAQIATLMALKQSGQNVRVHEQECAS